MDKSKTLYSIISGICLAFDARFGSHLFKKFCTVCKHLTWMSNHYIKVITNGK